MFRSKDTTEYAYLIKVEGLVQGVGFRPFVYRLAHECGLKGWTKNTNDSVVIFIQGRKKLIDKFLKRFHIRKPVASVIHNFNSQSVSVESIEDFSILQSEDISNDITLISPDIAVCPECLKDVQLQERRKFYPLVNCTHCGPRFSIIKELPYDRHHTTMITFEMCKDCHDEYENPLDRRFHAQPVACNNCGPVYQLYKKDEIITGIDKILEQFSESINIGKIFAIKGTGGFHLVCNANDEKAVNKLREFKQRDRKPFAVMFRDVGILQKYAHLSKTETDSLYSFRRPIVILNYKQILATSVSMGLNTVGAMLPYMPFHYLLFSHSKVDALVMTSGNITDEPIVIDNQKAINTFLPFVDGVITYNRDIHNRVDDSVVMISNNKCRIIRRSRGYVPSPIRIKDNTEGIFAAGAELTGTFAIGKNNYVFLSQYLGDLKNFGNYEFYLESYQRFKNLFRFKPALAVSDMHPDYLSGRFARELGVKTFDVQHHHAHIASCMAEHSIDDKVIGVAFDGTGYGDDGHIWGGEFLVCDLTGYERMVHFKYLPLPGGDKAVEEPWRIAVAFLYDVFGKDFLSLGIPFVKKLENTKTELIIQAIDKRINTPLISSAGRVFDAVSALCGLCFKTTFHAQAPMLLEAAINKNIHDYYPFNYKDGVIDFSSVFRALIDDLIKNKHVDIISSKFHNTISEIVVYVCKEIFNKTGIDRIALSGGTFQNRYLLSQVENKLKRLKFKVYSNESVPSNDGGIALGQLAIAAKRRII